MTAPRNTATRNTAPQLCTATKDVAYHEDASALFHALTSTNANDAVLLESADITSKEGLHSIAVLRGSLRLTCDNPRVVSEALTEVGQIQQAELVDALSSYTVDNASAAENTASFEFPDSTEVDERERLTAVSSIHAIRCLQNTVSYSTDMLPFVAGGIAFDYLETFEVLPQVGEGSNTYPDYQFLVAEVLLAIDHQTQTATLHAVGTDPEELESELDRIAQLIAQFDLNTGTAGVNENGGSLSDQGQQAATITATADIPDEEFRAQVEQLKGNITAGDIYQVVPARTFTVECPDAFVAYRKLRDTNPSPYMFYIRGEHAGRTYELFGASPESNLKFDAATRQVELYPIAGTRPRGLNPDGTVNHELDIRSELELRTDAKEIAEHTMLVDLARNDLARVAVPGTRRVADLMQVDRYSRVMHLVSRVIAELHEDFDALDAYRACMNMGTLTGAPKLRAMELLRGVEKKRRGSYGGAVGYLKGNGDVDNCIVIRSAFVQDGVASVQAGAGVVRDSNPQAEADETLHKAFAVLHAIAAAQGAQLEVVR